MQHFHRTHLMPVAVLATADEFFPALGMTPTASTARGRTFDGALGKVRLKVRPEGGHYTFVEVHTDQMGESRLDRNVKKFFVTLHRAAHPNHKLQAAF